TTTAVTSFSTATYANEHAVAGWWVHLRELEGPATVFAHDRARDGVSLHNLGVGVDRISAAPPILGHMARDALVLVPPGIVASPYTTYMSAGRTRRSYRTYGEACEVILNRVRDAEGPTFTYWYTPSPDSEAHDEGSAGERVFHAAEALNAALERL